VWGLIAALYIGNVMLLVLNLPLVGIFVRLLYLPMRFLAPVILVIAAIGVYNANQSIVDLLFLAVFGWLGYYMRTNGYPVSPVILGLVLGNRMEEALRQSMIMSQGNPTMFLERPIALAFLVLAVVALAVPAILKRIRDRNTGKPVEFERESV
jgi:putative tricarboxylic transport membrane protein